MASIKIKLPNNLYLTVENDPNLYGFHEVFVGITDENDRWLQDLAVVRDAYHYENGKVKLDNKIAVLVYADSEDDDYTNEFTIDFWKGAE